MKKLLMLSCFVLTLAGCEYQTETHRRIAFFYKTENGGEVSKSRDVGSFTQDRPGNAVDKWLRKYISDPIKK